MLTRSYKSIVFTSFLNYNIKKELGNPELLALFNVINLQAQELETFPSALGQP